MNTSRILLFFLRCTTYCSKQVNSVRTYADFCSLRPDMPKDFCSLRPDMPKDFCSLRPDLPKGRWPYPLQQKARNYSAHNTAAACAGPASWYEACSLGRACARNPVQQAGLSKFGTPAQKGCRLGPLLACVMASGAQARNPAQHYQEARGQQTGLPRRCACCMGRCWRA